MELKNFKILVLKSQNMFLACPWHWTVFGNRASQAVGYSDDFSAVKINFYVEIVCENLELFCSAFFWIFLFLSSRQPWIFILVSRRNSLSIHRLVFCCFLNSLQQHVQRVIILKKYYLSVLIHRSWLLTESVELD